MQKTSFKTKKRIFIRCATKPIFGLGHFKRCLTLTKELQKFDYDITFLINKNNYVINELKKNKIPYKSLENNFSIKQETEYIENLTKKSDIVIIDMKNFSENLTKKLKSKKIFTILLDDAWVKNVYSEIVVNPTGIKKYHNYKKQNKKIKILAGLKYYLIEKEFIKNRKKFSSIIDKKTYSVIVSIGGSDVNGVVLKILDSILLLKNIRIKVIAGPFSFNRKKLKNIEKNYSNVTLIHKTNTIWNEFKKSDLVISNSGNTLHELVAQNIPSMYIAVDKHQIPYGKFFSRKKFGFYLGFWEELEQDVIKNMVIKILENKSMRTNSIRNSNKIIDGQGTQRITFEINSFMKQLQSDN